MKPYRVGRIDEKDRVEIEYLCNNQWTIYIKQPDFEKLSGEGKLVEVLDDIDNILTHSVRTIKLKDSKILFQDGVKKR